MFCFRRWGEIDYGVLGAASVQVLERKTTVSGGVNVRFLCRVTDKEKKYEDRISPPRCYRGLASIGRQADIPTWRFHRFASGRNPFGAATSPSSLTLSYNMRDIARVLRERAFLCPSSFPLQRYVCMCVLVMKNDATSSRWIRIRQITKTDSRVIETLVSGLCGDLWVSISWRLKFLFWSKDICHLALFIQNKGGLEFICHLKKNQT